MSARPRMLLSVEINASPIILGMTVSLGVLLELKLPSTTTPA